MVCPECTSDTPDADVVCHYCGAPITSSPTKVFLDDPVGEVELTRPRRTVEARVGEPTRVCPRCLSPLAEVALAETRVDRCARCGGFFLAWPALRVPHGGTPTAPGGLLASCPRCQRPMRRARFGAGGPVIDECAAHGLWLDGAEAARARDLLRPSGRTPEPDRRSGRRGARSRRKGG